MPLVVPLERVWKQSLGRQLPLLMPEGGTRSTKARARHLYKPPFRGHVWRLGVIDARRRAALDATFGTKVHLVGVGHRLEPLARGHRAAAVADLVPSAIRKRLRERACADRSAV